jgi:hypothetical protein
MKNCQKLEKSVFPLFHLLLRGFRRFFVLCKYGNIKSSSFSLRIYLATWNNSKIEKANRTGQWRGNFRYLNNSGDFHSLIRRSKKSQNETICLRSDVSVTAETQKRRRHDNKDESRNFSLLSISSRKNISLHIVHCITSDVCVVKKKFQGKSATRFVRRFLISASCQGWSYLCFSRNKTLFTTKHEKSWESSTWIYRLIRSQIKQLLLTAMWATQRNFLRKQLAGVFKAHPGSKIYSFRKF